jgi:hypothetical protein
MKEEGKENERTKTRGREKRCKKIHTEENKLRWDKGKTFLLTTSREGSRKIKTKEGTGGGGGEGRGRRRRRKRTTTTTTCCTACSWFQDILLLFYLVLEGPLDSGTVVQ